MAFVERGLEVAHRRGRVRHRAEEHRDVGRADVGPDRARRLRARSTSVVTARWSAERSGCADAGSSIPFAICSASARW